MKPISTLLFLSCVALPLSAQGDMPKPTAEHQKLAASAGTWDATIESAGPDGQPSTSKGVSEMKVTMGGFWLIDDFNADFGGMPFQGHGVTGYDPLKGKYVTTWTDSMSPSLMVMEGGYDKAGKVLTMTGMGAGMDGRPAKMRSVSTEKDANTTVFEMFTAGADNKEARMLKITYTRRMAKPADATDAKKAGK